jgi:micrococcal nuclease
MEYKKITTFLVVVTVLIVCTCVFTGYVIVRAFTGPSIDENELYQVTEVKDGDTFNVKIGRHVETVRMLGIDTPETVDPRKPIQCYGKAASDETKHLLTEQSVRLKLNPDREEKDKYGRYLAYVFLGDVFVNEQLLKEGYAREYTFGTPYQHQREFREIEKEAKKNKKGLWGACVGPDYKTSKSL